MKPSFIKQVFEGKTIGRILFNRMVEKHCAALSGQVLDLGSGGRPSYRKFLSSETKLVTTDVEGKEGIDYVVDMNNPLPFPDASYQYIFCFNAVYAIEDPQVFMKEVYRVLRPGGKVFLSSPFISNEMPEPHDYMRLTCEGLKRLFARASFQEVSIEPYGERASSAVYLLHPVLHFNIIRLLTYVCALMVDKALPCSWKEKHPAPIGYFVIAKKK